MDAEEIKQIELLKFELTGIVNKKTAIDAKTIYNKYNLKEDEITDCMCSRIRRKILGNLIIEWYEAKD